LTDYLKAFLQDQQDNMNNSKAPVMEAMLHHCQGFSIDLSTMSKEMTKLLDDVASMQSSNTTTSAAYTPKQRKKYGFFLDYKLANEWSESYQVFCWPEMMKIQDEDLQDDDNDDDSCGDEVEDDDNDNEVGRGMIFDEDDIATDAEC